jgi:Fe2+ transport system protein FeoA
MKRMIKSLDMLSVGETGIIQAINTDYVTKERLESLGLILAVEIELMRQAPLGGVKVYKCLNTYVALRNEVACKIMVEVTNEKI